jgi:hypothetical protein
MLSANRHVNMQFLLAPTHEAMQTFRGREDKAAFILNFATCVPALSGTVRLLT